MRKWIDLLNETYTRVTSQIGDLVFIFVKPSMIGDVWTVERDGENVAGFQFDERFLDDGLMCVHLSVNTEYQRQGIGQQIYRFAAQKARDKNCKLVQSKDLEDHGLTSDAAAGAFKKAFMVEGIKYTALYHCTPADNLANIQAHGLDPQFSRGSEAVYLAGDELHAEGYDGHHQQTKSVMLAIDVSRLDMSKLGPDDADLPDALGDPDEWVNFDWQESIQICGQCCYHGVIPPSAIRYKHGNSFLSL